MKIKISLLLLCIIMFLSLFGCKTNAPEDDPIVPSTEGNATADQTEQTEQTEQTDDTDTATDDANDETPGQVIEQQAENTDQSETTDDVETNDNIQHESVADTETNNSNETDKVVEVNLPTLKFYTIEQMVASIKNGEYTDPYSNTVEMQPYNACDVGSIKYFHKLSDDALPTGYELKLIEIGSNTITYYYSLKETDVKNIFYERENLFQAYYQRPEKKNQYFQPLEMMYNPYTVYTEDRLLYCERENSITFDADDGRIRILVPDSMNSYEMLKPLCVAEKITIE